MNSAWQLGPGLTNQLGPFKTSKRDSPHLRKVPWKGGGTAGGFVDSRTGDSHAGNANWTTTMTPHVIYPAKLHLDNNHPVGLVSLYPTGPARRGSIKFQNRRNYATPGAAHEDRFDSNIDTNPAAQGTGPDTGDVSHLIAADEGMYDAPYFDMNDAPPEIASKTTQEIVLNFPEIPKSDPNERFREEDIQAQLDSLPSVTELHLRGQLRRRDRAIDALSLIANAPSTVEPRALELINKYNGEITRLESELSKVYAAGNELHGRYSSEQVLNDRERQTQNARALALENQIAELQARLAYRPSEHTAPDLLEQAIQIGGVDPNVYESVVQRRERPRIIPVDRSMRIQTGPDRIVGMTSRKRKDTTTYFKPSKRAKRGLNIDTSFTRKTNNEPLLGKRNMTKSMDSHIPIPRNKRGGPDNI